MQFLMLSKKKLLYKSLVCVQDLRRRSSRANYVDGCWGIRIAGLNNYSVCKLYLEMYKLKVLNLSFKIGFYSVLMGFELF